MNQDEEITYRNIETRDAELFRKLLKDKDIRRNTWLQIPPDAEIDCILHYCFLKGYQRYILENKEKTAIGTFSFHKNGAFAEGGIFLLPEFRGKGYGKKAFQIRSEILKEYKVRFLRNEIFLDNHASVHNNLKSGAREFGWWSLRLQPMKSKYLTLQTRKGRIELCPFCSEDSAFYRKLFSEETTQFQTYSETDLSTCPEEDLIRFLMADSDRRWTVWLHQGESKQAIGTAHLYERSGPASNFGFLMAENQRGNGYGQATLQLIKLAASLEGIKILRADVFFESKAAIACMEKEGFRQFGFYETFVK